MSTGLTNAINANSTTPLLPILGGTGVSSPTAHGVLIGEGASAVSPIVLTAGQVLIGTTSGDPSGATLTAGSGINITSLSGSITIAGMTWSQKNTATTLAPSNGYFTTSGSTVVFTLPATAAIGDTYQVTTAPTGIGGWEIAQNSGQSIVVGNTTTTVGTGGSISSESTLGDWIVITCAIANTGFVAYIAQGEVSVI